MLKIVCFFSTLCKLARAEYDAKGTEHYEEAARAHEAYKQLCLECDEMVIPQIRSRQTTNV